MARKAGTTVSDAAPQRTWQDTLAALVSLLDLGRGQFTLVFVTYERPRQRQRIITALRQALPGWTLAPVSLQDTALDLRNLSGRFFTTLQDIARRQGQTCDAVLLLDWEQRLAPDQPPEQQPSTSLVGVFNRGRHLLEQAFACPVVVLVPQWAMATLLQLAPDFVSWQSGAYFVPFDVAAVAAELRAAVAAARTTPRQAAAATTERLEACLDDVPTEGESGLPAELVAEALAEAGELSLTLNNAARAEMHFARLEDWVQIHGLKQWQRRARRGRRRAIRRKLRQLPLPAVSGTAPWDVFRGAAAITDEDSIYGREEDLRQILELIIAPGFRLGTLWGETGCGKTSLVRAGLMPALQRQGYLPVYLNRYDDPEADVSRAVATAAGLGAPAASLAETLRAATQAADKTIVLLCDQFEQVFTNLAMRDRQKRTAFLRHLADCVNNLTFVRCLLLTRADHLYYLTEFDTLTPLHHPLSQDKRYELRWLRQADAARVLSGMKDAARAVWPDTLISAVVADLASDGRVKPVQIQLVAAGLYLRHMNTLDAYIEVGRVDGVLKDYLTAVFDTLSQPALARRVVRSLVMPGNPAVRLSRSISDIAREIRAPESAVQAILDGMMAPHVVQTHRDTALVTYELVHDVLVEPALLSTTAQEVGLSIIRSALAQRRWRLRWGEYGTAKRSDVTELPERRQPAARQLLQRTFYMRLGLVIAVVCIGLFGLVTVVQLTTAHAHIESNTPEPLMVRRGLRQLDFLPGFLGPVPLFDTGLTVEDVPSYKRTSLEARTLYSWDDTINSRTHQLSEHLQPASAAKWLFSIGDWEGGFRIVGDITRRDPPEMQEVLDGVGYIIPEEAIPSLRVFATRDNLADNPASARVAVVYVLGRLGGRHAAETIPALLPLLGDPNRGIRGAAAQALGQIGRAQAADVVPALLPLLHDPTWEVQEAAALALGQIGRAQATDVVPALLPLLRNLSWRVRGAAVQALGGLMKISHI